MSPSRPAVSAARHRRRGTVLLVLAVWQTWLWTTRAYNLVSDRDEFSLAFVAVHLVLFTVSFGMAAYLAVVGWRMRTEAAAGEGATEVGTDQATSGVPA